MQADADAALIIGVSSQDGAYLAKHLLQKGLKVHGTSRDKEVSSFAGLNALGIYERVNLHSMVLNDFRRIITVLSTVRPRYIYNLAAQSSVGLSFEQPVETIDSIMHGTINVMEAIRFLALDARFYNASSSECFGNTCDAPAEETTCFRPRSPYAVGKAAAFWAVSNYREAYGLYAASGLLFNHESPLRPTRFVTQKIVRGVIDIKAGVHTSLQLGALELHRDWGWAAEYVDAMARMLDLSEPTDFVIATGESHSLKDFVAGCFAYVGLNWQEYVTSSGTLLRPTDIVYSSGNPAKAKKLLNWSPQIKMPQVVELLMEAEQARRQGRTQ